VPSRYRRRVIVTSVYWVKSIAGGSSASISATSADADGTG
jgi:hypothetical protein